MMKALRRNHMGILLTTEMAPTPSIADLADDEALVRVVVASVNPADIKAGGSTPYSTGLDGAGIVVGERVGNCRNLLGKRVAWHGPLREMKNGRPQYGSFGEYAISKIHALVEIPESMSFETASILPCPGGTAAQIVDALDDAITAHGTIQAVFMQGANGAVASLAVQLLKIRHPSLLVIGSVHPEAIEKRLFDNSPPFEPIPYGEQELPTLNRLRVERGIELVGIVDFLGETAQHHYDYLRDHGARRSVLVSVLSPPNTITQNGPSLNVIALGAAYDIASEPDTPHHVFGYQDSEPILSMAQAYKKVIDLVAAGQVQPPPLREVNLEEMATIVNGGSPLRGKPVMKFGEEISIQSENFRSAIR